jgi:enoyl-CoA hydratase
LSVLHIDERGQVLLLTLNRPERRNALSLGLLHALGDAIEAARPGCERFDVRCIVVTGAGGAFCAGADLTGVEDDSFAAALRRVLDGLRTLPVATIAAVDGPALGGGTQLAVACDLRVATPRARFGIPAARLSLVVDAWTVERIALLAGHGAARAILLAAEQLPAEEAHRLGLVQRLGDLDVALAWADQIAELAPLTIAGHKLALEALAPPLPADAAVVEASHRAWSSHDHHEGIAAFLEKRAPRFQGR